MRLSYLFLPFTFILSCIAQNWDENLEYFPEEEEFLIEEEYINGEGLLVLEDAEASFSIFGDIGNWVNDAAANVGDAIADTAGAIGDGITGLFDKDNSQPLNSTSETEETPETSEVIDIVSPITWNSTLEGYIITAYREENVIPDEPGSRMSTNVTFVISGYYAGRITAETKIWTETPNWGFAGEVYVELLGENNITIGTTGNHSVGVNGEMLDPTDRDKFWEEWLQVSWAQLTVSLRIVQSYNPESLPVVEEESNFESWPVVGEAWEESIPEVGETQAESSPVAAVTGGIEAASTIAAGAATLGSIVKGMT